ncbi:hypothetical protein [Streptomyces roseolilacinus]|nr:hypothetical protein [Streptomyces roseolilacinus]
MNGKPGSIEATIDLLRAELPRLEERQQELEKELAAVTDRLESVRSALTALQTLSAAGPAQQPAAVPGAESGPSVSAEAELATGPKAVMDPEKLPPAETEPSPEPQAEAPAAPARRAPRKTAARTEGKQPAKKTSQQKQPRRSAKAAPAKRAKGPSAKKTTAAPSGEEGTGLTEQVLGVLAESGGDPVRARDVNQALKRDDSPGSINAVRSTLDRLVATSRAHRAGRGLYQAAPAS